VIERVLPYIQRMRFDFQTPGRPMGVFLFCGQSGSGKTEIIRQPGKAERIGWIQIYRLLKILASLLIAWRRKLVIEVAPLKIKLVCLRVLGIPLQHRRFLRAQQFNLQSSHNGQRDLILNIEDVFHLAVVPLRPELIAISPTFIS
jgi:hypothetical protein